MLALLIKYKLAVLAAALLGAAGLGGVGVAAANGALPLAALNLQRAGPDRLASHILHGVVIVKDQGAWVTYTLDSGKVASASASSITLTRADGSSVTLSVTTATRWGAKGAAPVDFSRLTGRRVAVLSQNGVAARIGGRGIVRGFAYADLTLYRNGKTREVQIARGAVQTISSTQISLIRADGVAYTATLAAHVRYHQAGVKGPAAASAVTPGKTVSLLIANGQVVAIRIAAR